MKQRAALCLITLVLASTDSATAEDLASLREKIANNLATMSSLEVKYQYLRSSAANDSALTSSQKARFFPPGYDDPEVYLWAKQGVKESFERESSLLKGKSDIFSRIQESFDGRQFVQFHFSNKNPNEIQTVNIRNAPPLSDLDDREFAVLLGMHVRGTRLTLFELLGRKSTRYVGTEDIAGHLCHKVEFDEYEGYTDFVMRLTIWFDAQSDYLPRKLLTNVVRQKSNNKPFPHREERVITEFTEVDDPLLRRKRWFPSKAIKFGFLRIETLDVRMNPTFSVERFAPKIPDGTSVVYWDQRVPIAGTSRTRTKSEITGGTVGQELYLKRAEQRSANARDEQLKANERAAKVNRIWSFVAIAVATTVLSAIIVLIWRRSRLKSR